MAGQFNVAVCPLLLITMFGSVDDSWQENDPTLALTVAVALSVMAARTPEPMRPRPTAPAASRTTPVRRLRMVFISHPLRRGADRVGDGVRRPQVSVAQGAPRDATAVGVRPGRRDDLC